MTERISRGSELVSCHFAGVDPAERAILEAALAQHASSPDSGGGPVYAAAVNQQPQQDVDVPQADVPGGTGVPVSATTADGMTDVTEALCCPITHVRHCLSSSEVISLSIASLMVPSIHPRGISRF